MPKITSEGVTDKTLEPTSDESADLSQPVPNAVDLDFADADPGELEGVEHPADGTLSPEIEGDGTGEPLAPIVDRPAVSATKGEWVEYAVARGHDRADAEALTKAKLLDLYGPDGSPAD